LRRKGWSFDEGAESKDPEIDRVAHDDNPWLFGEMDGESVFKVIESENEGTLPASCLTASGSARNQYRLEPPSRFIHEIWNQIKETDHSDVNNERKKKEKRGR
jgi:hypothetical protein